jgi:hypothetical protein
VKRIYPEKPKKELHKIPEILVTKGGKISWNFRYEYKLIKRYNAGTQTEKSKLLHKILYYISATQMSLASLKPDSTIVFNGKTITITEFGKIISDYIFKDTKNI